MRGGRRQHRRRQAGIILTMLACLDGGKRLCGEVDANISTGGRLSLLPAIPCAFVPGSKIFTFPLPDLSFPAPGRPVAVSLACRQFCWRLEIKKVMHGRPHRPSVHHFQHLVPQQEGMSSMRRCFPSTDSNTRISQLWGFGRQQMPFFRSIMYPVRARMIPPWQDTSTFS